MATVVGPWQGSSPRARMEIDYAVTRSADGTSATATGTCIFASEFNMTDTSNAWSVWGAAGDHSGTNVNISHPSSSGGRTGFFSFTIGIGSGGADIGMRFTGLEAPGVTVEAVLHLDGVALAPYTDGSYYAADIAATNFRAAHFIANGNGGSLTNVAVQVNTSETDVGAIYKEAGSWVEPTVTGLVRATKYYFRARIANSTYGWGPWGPWKEFTTLAVAPSSPGTSADTITPTSMRIVVTSSGDSGGVPIDLYEAYVMSNNAYPDAGGVVVASASGGTFVANGLIPSTQYYYTSRSRNTAGLWSPWTPMKAATTLPSAVVNVSGVYKNAIPFVCIEPNVWRMAIPLKNVGGGVWRQ